MPNNHLPFGIDLSKYNTSADGKKKVDFDIINATNPPKVQFVAMRAGISWGYQDPWFSYYFTEGSRIDKILMPYHVIYPGQPADRQMDNFFRILGNINFKTTPLVIDLELDHGQPVSTITNTTIKCVSMIMQRTGRKPIIYSRAQWINTFLRVSELPPVHWWLAQYRYSLPYPLYTPEFPCPPTLPRGVAEWKFHQSSQRGRSIGAPGLYYMDYNRFNGTLADLYSFAGLDSPVLATCPLDQQPCAAGKTITSYSPTFRVQLNQGYEKMPTFSDKSRKEKDLLLSLKTGRGLDAIPVVGFSFLKDKRSIKTSSASHGQEEIISGSVPADRGGLAQQPPTTTGGAASSKPAPPAKRSHGQDEEIPVPRPPSLENSRSGLRSTGKPPDGARPLLPTWIGHKQHFSPLKPKE